jgi:hypothetical protein
MSSKIIIIHIYMCRLQDSTEDELRYVLWKAKEGPERVMLPYVDMTLEEIFGQATYEYNARGRVGSDKIHIHTETDETSPAMSIAARLTVTLGTDFEVRYLGDHEDAVNGTLKCYAVQSENTSKDDRISLRRMPLWGYSSVVYRPDTVRESIKHRDIVGTHLHSTDGTDQSALFEFIDGKVQALMAVTNGQ